ncbi:MAG: hypothetical protein JSW11_14965 [Candidatus Heimdallarchaeota archaeon]|nr:MAG: hypothetical protein JSW11_14965 [Candidatus Heimdallarchaeota archaeon]
MNFTEENMNSRGALASFLPQYWSDYNGSGSYFIAGSAGTSDFYPSGGSYHPTPSVIDLSGFFSLLVRIDLFLGILGVLAVTIFLSRCR